MRRAAVLAVLAAAVAYWPALSNGFVAYDDLEAIVYNDAVRGLGLWNLRWMATSFEQSTWQPLPWLAYALIHAVQGAAPFGHHAFMLLLHALNAALVAGLAFTLLVDAPAAALAGALFAAHPVQAESVASAASISDIMAATFALASLLAYARTPETRRPAAAWAFFALAALCRWQALCAAAAAPLLDWARGRRLRGERLWPFAAGSAVLIAVYAAVKSGELEASSRFDAGAAAAAVLVYLEKLLTPSGYLPFYNIAPPEAPWSILFPAVAAVLTAALAYLARRRREPLAAWLLFLLFVAPTLAMRRDDVVIARDRYAYAGFLGFYLLAAAGWLWARRRAAGPVPRAVLAAGALLVLGAMTAVSRERAQSFRDPETFWTAVLEVEPRVYIARPHIGEARLRRGDFDGAVQAFASQLDMFPDDRHGAHLLACALGRGEPEGSLAAAGRMGMKVKTRVERAGVLNDIGLELARAGLYEKAREFYERALELGGESPGARHNLAFALLKLGERDAAAASARRALELKPGQELTKRLLRRIEI